MASVGQNITIRRWSPGDDDGVWSVLSDGSYSLVNSTFTMCLKKRTAKVAIIVLLGICMVLKIPILYIVVMYSIFFLLIYIISLLGSVIYLYGSTLKDLKDISKSYFEDSDHHFWVAVCDGEIAGTIAIVKKKFPLVGSPEALEKETSPEALEKETSPEALEKETKVQRYGSKVDITVKDGRNKIAMLRRMSVKRQFRGLGIARKLVLEAVSFCRQSSYSKIFLITTEVHHAARSLYSKLGFHLSAVRPYRYLSGLVTVKTFEYEMDL